ncbi:uncharacterized protein V6R79_014250 [Siganus canaliculatus]
MTSRRPMTRTYSGNGRTSSFSEEEGVSSNGRPESRNTYLSNVRPENRSTLCSVMAQLTEDIQPSFETTLKSKAVSENCNVKFTCVVSGYPAPELKWYKDDVEMDRYCGLPKYEIRRNGKTHTLHIYNCTVDDAAIYQVSASNSKGIVSCSGVLEVGTMNEYKIHQRFFAKLKQKAEKKKHDMEVTKKEDKESIQKEKQQKSPERPQRKRHIPPPEVKPVTEKPQAVEPVGAAAEVNGLSPEVEEKAAVTTKNSDTALSEEKDLTTKKIKISNGVNDVAAVNINSVSGKSHAMGNGGENCYDGGIGLAQFLAEALRSQAADEKQNVCRAEKAKEVDAPVDGETERDRECEGMQKVREEREQKEQKDEPEREKQKEELFKQNERKRETEREREMEAEREKERGRDREKDRSREREKPTKHSEIRHHSKGHKDLHEHHNIQASISSMIHSVKDFLFGKSKKDSHELPENRERGFDQSLATTQPPPPEMPPSFQLQPEPDAVSKPLTDDAVSMEIDHSEELPKTVDIEQQSVSPEPHEHKHEDTVVHTDLQPVLKLPPESMEESTGQSMEEAEDAMEAMEVSAEPESSSQGEGMALSGPQFVLEADSQVVSVFRDVPEHCQEADGPVVSPHPIHQFSRDDFVLPQTQTPLEDESTPTSTQSGLEESWTPPRAVLSGLSLGETATETLQEEERAVDTTGKEDEPDRQESCSFNKQGEGRKAEVKSDGQPHSDINSSDVSGFTTSSLEERIETRESKTKDQVLLPLSAALDHSAVAAIVKEEPVQTSQIQEMNVGFPPAEALESLEMGGLKIQQKDISCELEANTEVHNLSATERADSGVNREDRSELSEVSPSVLENEVEVNMNADPNKQAEAVLEGESTEAKNDSLEVVVERTKVNPDDEESDESITQTQEDSVNVLEDRTNDAEQDNNKRQQDWPLENIPQIQISTTEDTPDIQPSESDVNPNMTFVVPDIEIMEPEAKESTLPLTILALNKQEVEPSLLQKHDATQVSIAINQEQSLADSPSLVPTQTSMQNDFNHTPTENTKEVAQFDYKAKGKQPPVESSEQTHQLDFSTIPLISVSFTDEKEEGDYTNAQVSDVSQPSITETLPLFVVPPISITCHDSDSAQLSTQSESTDIETSAVIQRGTKNDVDNNVTIMPERPRRRKQMLEETAEKSAKANTPSVLIEPATPSLGDNGSLLSCTTEDKINIAPEILKTKPLKEAKIENNVSAEDIQKNRSSVDRLSSKPPAHPSLSPGSLRKFMSKTTLDSDSEAVTPVITVGDRLSDKADDDLSGGSTPTSSLSCESSPRLKRRDSLSLIRSATPEELASGARRKIFIPKPKEEEEGTVVGSLDAQGKKETPYMSPSQARRAALLQAPMGQNTPPMERRSPLLSRRKITLEVPKVVTETPIEEPVSTKREEKPAEKKLDPLKAPQVIRKIRGEPFPDASGHLKLWCQFFNVLSDSTIKWYRDEEEILEVKRSGGDESQVALAIVLASGQDCGVYGCSISNEYGTDTTDYLLSIDIMSEILLKDDLEVGEEIEMTPLQFTKGLADCGTWGGKYFGRIMMETVHMGEGCAHKASRVKVIYGLDPIFESGSTCIIKVQNPIAYGTKEESNLAERNMEIIKQECKVQNMIREYCKIFAAEARVKENFGCTLEVTPQYLMYRPANSVPYATVEIDLKGVFLKYCMMDPKGRLITRKTSEVEQKCCTFQHWIHQWTHGNLLVTRLEGVGTKITNIRVVTKSKGYQGLTECGSPEVFEQFLTHHQCNYYCGLLGLQPLKTMEQPSTKIKGSRSPLLNRKGGSSPQMQRKGHSPQMIRKANSSPKVSRKGQETEDNKSSVNPKPADTVDVLEMR